MMGVTGSVAATLGLLQPNMENFVQMSAAMGAGMFKEYFPQVSVKN